MRRALVISGGGANGLWGLVQARRLANEGLSYDYYLGESIGAVCALLCAIMGPEEAIATWQREVRPDSIFKGGGFWQKVGLALGKRRGLYDMSPARATLHRACNNRPIPAGKIVVAHVVDLNRGVLLHRALTPETHIDDAVITVYRSCLVPLAHGADAGRWADGGVMATAPLDPAIALGADVIDVVLLNPIGVTAASGFSSAAGEVGRSIELLRDQLLLRDLELADRVNRAPIGAERQVAINVYEPTVPLGNWMDFSAEANRPRLTTTYVKHTLAGAVQHYHRMRQRAANLATREWR